MEYSKERVDDPADLTASTALVPAVAEALTELFPGEDIVGLDVVFVTSVHSDDGEHKDCKVRHRHLGGIIADGNRELMEEMVNAVETSGRNLRARLEAMPASPKKEVSH